MLSIESHVSVEVSLDIALDMQKIVHCYRPVTVAWILGE